MIRTHDCLLYDTGPLVSEEVMLFKCVAELSSDNIESK